MKIFLKQLLGLDMATKSLLIWPREHQLYAKFSKCDFFKNKILYLGHVVTKEGISIGLKKIKAIEEWPIPKDVTNIRSFLGITGYYRIFIERVLNN